MTDTFYTAGGLSVPNVYDVYVRAICGAGDTSLARMTNVAVDYCASNATSTADSKIGFVAIDADTVVAATACATYTDNRGTPAFALQYAIPHQLAIEYARCGTSDFSSYVKVYVDFNHDLVFDETSELIAEGSALAAAPLIAAANMPLSGTVGNTTMRVVLR